MAVIFFPNQKHYFAQFFLSFIFELASVTSATASYVPFEDTPQPIG